MLSMCFVVRCLQTVSQKALCSYRRRYVYQESLSINPLIRRVKFHLPFASIIGRFNVYESVHRKYIPIYIQQAATLQFIYIWKLLYMFRVVLSPIIRSAYNCIYIIWYLSHRYCYLHTQTGSNSSTIAADSSNGVTNTRCCRYRCIRSWWWVEVPPETCRAVSRYK